MLICRRISDHVIYPDFQSNPSPGTLIANAVRAGFALVADLEEIDVTQAQFDAAVTAAYGAQRAADAAARLAVRNRIITLLQSSVGVQVENLTAAQVKALLVGIAFNVGALDSAGKVAPLSDWLTN